MSEFHRHTDECRVPLTEVFTPPPGNKKDYKNFAYYYYTADDGRIFTKLNDMYALEACSFMSIPIFLPGKPEGLP